MKKRRSLHEIFLSNGGPVVNKWLHYFDIYEKHFARFVGTAPTILEIGVFKGGSLYMWQEYFGEGTRIVGLDINPDCTQYAGENIEVVIGSQDDPAVLDDLLSRYQFDIVLDDGSHVMEHLNASFRLIYDRISPDGVYMLEDLHTCYLPRWGGGLKREGSFMETVKDRIDDLHATYCKDLPVSDFTRSTASINIYDSIVAFEKRPQGARLHVKSGAMGLLPSDFAR
jgi:SAM-dependent methyltransferase